MRGCARKCNTYTFTFRIPAVKCQTYPLSVYKKPVRQLNKVVLTRAIRTDDRRDLFIVRLERHPVDRRHTTKNAW